MEAVKSPTEDSEANALMVGRVPFLVCAPFFHATMEGAPGIHFVDGVPSVLNRELRAGRIDCAPSSSIEYARCFQDYLILPGISTSSRMEMKSVLFLSNRPWEDLQDAPVALSQDSATSNVLFQILSVKRFGVRPRWFSPGFGEADAEARAVGRVFIGDSALRESFSGKWPHRYDLGDVWVRWQGLPFTFGLWMVRREAWRRKQAALVRFHTILLKGLADFRTDPEKALRAWTRAYPCALPPDHILRFYETADYGFSPDHARSLEIFFRLAREEGHLEDLPVLEYAAP
jgi:chorismate dehydratase